MRAIELYRQLDSDFQTAHIRDDWSFLSLNKYISSSFCAPHYAGIVLDNARDVHKVYTAVFPDLSILNRLIQSGETDVLLFCHHAMGYDGNREGFPFYDIPPDLLAQLKERRIAFYMLHAALDRNGPFSTSVCLANALGLEIVRPFCEYDGIQVGVVCKTDLPTAAALAEQTRRIMGHEVKLRDYGEQEIRGGLVGVAAGGGTYPFVANELVSLGINLYVTGVTRPVPSFEPTLEFHRIAKQNGVSVIGATHYSTEQFACRAVAGYFATLGLPAEFLPGQPCLNDL